VADKVYFSVATGPGSTTEGVTVELLNSCGSVDSAGVYTAPAGENCAATVKVSKGGEWAKVFILVKEGMPEVIEGIKIEDVNMDTVVDVNDLTPLIDWILK